MILWTTGTRGRFTLYLVFNLDLDGRSCDDQHVIDDDHDVPDIQKFKFVVYRQLFAKMIAEKQGCFLPKQQQQTRLEIAFSLLSVFCPDMPSVGITYIFQGLCPDESSGTQDQRQNANEDH